MQKYGFCFLNVMLLQIVRNAFRGWMWISHRIFATLFQFVSSVVGRPLAAVGAYLSCPHIRIYPQNGEQKCVCDEMNMCIWWCVNAYLAMEKYGHDESVPYAWRNVRGAFRGQTWIFHRMFVTCSLSVCYINVIQKYGFCRVKVWFLPCKKGVFTTQKGGFWKSI